MVWAMRYGLSPEYQSVTSLSVNLPGGGFRVFTSTELSAGIEPQSEAEAYVFAADPRLVAIADKPKPQPAPKPAAADPQETN